METRVPLAERMRPTCFEEFVGQQHIVGKNTLLYRAIKYGTLGSCIFYGPPGTGKTTLGNIIAKTLRANYVKLNAVTSGVADAKAVIERARTDKAMLGKDTFLILDECHRWNKAQSDCVLEAIENGEDYNGNNSHKASGPLIDGIALCSGYSDAMKIYLDKLKVPNYKISNSNHIWNLVYLDGQWLHLDLTWDDPVTTDGSNILLYKFFLISTDELHKLDATGHNFNVEYYPETQNS